MSAALDGKVPKSVLLAREKLAKANLSVTVDNLERALSGSELSQLTASMRYIIKKGDPAGADSVAQTYQNLNDEAKRKEWLASFLVDPSCANLAAKFVTKREFVTGEQGRRLWLTVEQLASPTCFNSKVHAELIAKAAPSRPSSIPALAAADVLEYFVELSEEMWKKMKTESSEVTADTTLKKDDCEKVRKSLASSSASPPRTMAKKRKNVSPQDLDALSPATKAKVEDDARKGKAKQELAKSLRSSKSLADKVRRELESDLKHSLNLVTLGYPREMAQFYSDAFQEVSTQAAELLETWTDYAKADTTAKSTTELEDMTSMLKEKHDLVEKGVKHIDPKRKQLYSMVGTEKPKKDSKAEAST